MTTTIPFHEEAVRIIDPAVDPHRPAPTAGDRLLEGSPPQDHLADPGVRPVPADPSRRDQSRAVSRNPRRRDRHPRRPADRRVAGVAFATVLSPLLGRKQARLAYQDEINVFRGTLLYAGPPNSTRGYDVGGPGEQTGARALAYLRRREGVGTRPFRKHLTDELVPANTGALTELRSHVFMPWNEKLWDTPNVAHDNPADHRFHASLFLGFPDASARAAFFDSAKITTLSDELLMFASAVHAYDVSAALTYVTNGDILPHYQE